MPESLDRTAPAHVATQCRYPDGRTGSFLFQGDVKNPSRVGPYCVDLVELFSWCRANGWMKQGAGYTAPYVHASAV